MAPAAAELQPDTPAAETQPDTPAPLPAPAESVDCSGEQPAPEPTASLPEPEAPPATPGYNALWQRIVNRAEQIAAIQADCRADAAQLLGGAVSLISDRHHGSFPDLDQARKDFLALLIRKASQAFTVPGIELKIDEMKLWEALGTKANYAPDRYGRYGSYEETQARLQAEFDPDAVWAWLEAEYGGDAGQRAALQQVAAKLVSDLGLEHRKPGESKGRLQIECRVWAEERYRGGRKYSYDTQNRLNQVLRGLAAFADWAGDPKVAHALRHQKVEQLAGYDTPLVSRSKATFAGAIEFQFFYEKAVLTFSQELGQQFRLFIAKFGPRPNPNR